MLEVRSRAGLARVATWTIGEIAVATPTILFVATPRHPVPPFAELVLRETPIAGGPPSIIDGGSIFRPRPVEGPLVIPPDAVKPMSLPDLERPPSPSGPFVVATTAKDAAAHPEAEVVAMGDAIAYLRHPKAFAAATAEFRRAMGYARLLYVPGLATPGNLPILAYCGVDLVDSTRIAFESTLGRFHTSDGAWAATEVDPNACGCGACLAAAT